MAKITELMWAIHSQDLVLLNDDSSPALGDIAPAEYLPLVNQKYPGALTKQFVPSNQHLWRMKPSKISSPHVGNSLSMRSIAIWKS